VTTVTPRAGCFKLRRRRRGRIRWRTARRRPIAGRELRFLENKFVLSIVFEKAQTSLFKKSMRRGLACRPAPPLPSAGAVSSAPLARFVREKRSSRSCDVRGSGERGGGGEPQREEAAAAKRKEE
jgi:hypothetical protein